MMIPRHRQVSRVLVFTIALVGTAAMSMMGVAAQGEPTQIAITAPTPGEAVSGAVTISGSADHPSQFTAYQLWFALSGTEQWFPVTGPVQEPVQQGVLGQWDTSALPPGQYDLRLQVFLADGNVSEVRVDNLEVQPARQPAFSNPAEPPPATIAPTEMPALAAPVVPAAEGPVEVGAQDGPAQGTAPYPDFGNAFCTGALLGVGLMALAGAYLFLRNQARSAVRRASSRPARGRK